MFQLLHAHKRDCNGALLRVMERAELDSVRICNRARAGNLATARCGLHMAHATAMTSLIAPSCRWERLTIWPFFRASRIAL